MKQIAVWASIFFSLAILNAVAGGHQGTSVEAEVRWAQLYHGSLTGEGLAAITSELDRANLDYRIAANAVILVEEKRRDQVRAKLAIKGWPQAGHVCFQESMFVANFGTPRWVWSESSTSRERELELLKLELRRVVLKVDGITGCKIDFDFRNEATPVKISLQTSRIPEATRQGIRMLLPLLGQFDLSPSNVEVTAY